MDEMKKKLIQKVLTTREITVHDIKTMMNKIETIIDSDYKSSGGVIGEFETWACFFAHDKMYKITHTTNEFLVQPLEKVDE